MSGNLISLTHEMFVFSPICLGWKQRILLKNNILNFLWKSTRIFRNNSYLQVFIFICHLLSMGPLSHLYCGLFHNQKYLVLYTVMLCSRVVFVFCEQHFFCLLCFKQIFTTKLKSFQHEFILSSIIVNMQRSILLSFGVPIASEIHQLSVRKGDQL